MQIRIRDPESFLPWIRDGKIRIRDKHPQHCYDQVQNDNILVWSTVPKVLLAPKTEHF
jgi:hypothetical protein